MTTRRTSGCLANRRQIPALRKRRFVDAFTDLRCEWTVTLPVGSAAQCGRAKKVGQLCTQHAKIHKRWACAYCGGNDELPPDHCVDCTRPAQAMAAKKGQS